MKKVVRDHLHKLEDDVNDAMAACAARMLDSCDTMEESVEAMDGMVQALVNQTHHAAWSLISASMDSYKREFGDYGPTSCLSVYAKDLSEHFRNGLIERVGESLVEEGKPNIFDPNAKLREELLED